MRVEAFFEKKEYLSGDEFDSLRFACFAEPIADTKQKILTSLAAMLA